MTDALTTSVSHEAEDRKARAWVYFIQAGEGGPIKIGYSANPRDRMASLQTASSVRLKLLGVVPGAGANEQALHERFGDLRTNGEWFLPSARLLGFIEGVLWGAGESAAPRSEEVVLADPISRRIHTDSPKFRISVDGSPALHSARHVCLMCPTPVPSSRRTCGDRCRQRLRRLRALQSLHKVGT